MLEFEQFYKNTRNIVRQYVKKHARDSFDAEDLEQEVYLKAFEQWQLLQEHPNPAGWLLLTLRNLCRSSYRVGSRYETLFEYKEIPYVESAYGKLVMEDFLESVYNQKDVYVAKKYFLDGDSIEELSEELGISRHSFRTRLYRMRRRLKSYIES